MLLAAVCCFVFGACKNNQKTEEVADTTAAVVEQPVEAPVDSVAEACKAECAAWADWANQTPEMKQQLIAKRKACIDTKLAECQPTDKAKQAEKAAFEKKWAKFDKLTIDEQKALIDEFPCKHEGDQACCNGEKKDCKGDCKGDCKSDCKKECQHK